MRGGGIVMCLVLAGVGLTHTQEDLGAGNVMDKVLQERTRQLLEDESFDLSSSPVHDRFTRNSSCSGVTEEVITYK